MKIAVIGIRGLPANYGGFETCAENISKEWSKNGHDVLIYCRKNHYKEHIAEYNGCRLKYISSINTKSLGTLSHTFFCILNLIFKEPDIKIIHLYNAGNALFIPLLKLFGKKVVISVDGIEWKRKKWGTLAKMIHKTGEKFAIRFADKVVVDNKAVENYYKNKHDADTFFIPYGAKIIDTVNTINTINTESVLNKFSLTTKDYFIFIGRLVPEKGVHTLIGVYNTLKTDIPLVIIGDDNNTSDYKHNLIKQKSDKVLFLGYLYGEEYESLLKNALIYVTASELEGTSPSLLAAMGAKVCTLVNGIEENLHTIEDSGCYYKENNLSDFSKVWLNLINNRDLIDEFAEKGYNRVLSVYKWEIIAEMYIDLFQYL